MPHRNNANRPVAIHAHEMAERFLVASQDDVRWFLQRQVERAERLGVGDLEWVNQLRGCVARIDAALDGAAQEPSETGLRLVPPAS